MDQHQVQALATLLQRSLNSVVVRDDSRNQHMSLDNYRENLQRSWRAHGADLNLLLTNRYKPLVEDAALRRELLQAVTEELGPHIHEATIQTAAIAVIGGPAPGFPLEDLMRHILNVAIVRGTLQSAEAFYRCIERDAATYQLFGLLAGVRVDQELQISPGIKLVPIPNSTSELPPHLPLWPHWSPVDLLGRTLIAIDHNISPIFLNPRLCEMDVRGPFTDSATSAEYPDFNIERFCQALSLAGDASIVCAANWTYIEPTEIFNVWGAYRGGAHTFVPSLMHRRGSLSVTQDDVVEAMALYRGIENLKSDDAARLRVPVDRWTKSKANHSVVDTFIDLGIALESLFLGNNRGSCPPGPTLRRRAAWYLGTDPDDTQRVAKQIGDVYGRRSSAVHHGVVRSSQKSRDLQEKGHQLCLQSIVKVIRDGGFPDWSQSDLGDADQGRGEITDQAADL